MQDEWDAHEHEDVVEDASVNAPANAVGNERADVAT